MLNKALDLTSDILYTIGALFKVEAGSYFDLETVENDGFTFVRHDGSLCSIINLRGVRRLIGSHELNDYLEDIYNVLSSLMNSNNHRIQFVYKCDPDSTERVIDESLSGARETAKRLELDLGWILDSKAHTLKDYCEHEFAWIAISTNHNFMTPVERKAANEEIRLKTKEVPKGRFTQDMTGSSSAIYNLHTAQIEGLLTGLKNRGVVCNVLNAHEAIKSIRLETDSDYTSDSWRASLPGDKIPARFSDGKDLDYSSLLHPRLKDQVFPRGAGMIRNHRWIEVGDKIHAPVVLSLPPQHPQPFQRLLNSIKNSGIPLRISFDIKPDGLSAFWFKSIIASVLHITSNTNKQFNAAIQGLQQEVLNGECIVGYKISADTWADIDDISLIRQRSSRLVQCIQAWGNCETADVYGDPLAGLTSTLPGASSFNPGPSCADDLANIITMLPLTRPSSPWVKGALPFRTRDKKLMSYQPGSSLQASWFTIGFAPMGQGKSVLLNAHNLALLLGDGLEHIPYISILDIGPSSSGLIDLVRASLPEGKKHYAKYERLQMTPEYAINPFDLPLGMRKPHPHHKAMLSNLLCALCSEDTTGDPEMGVPGIVSRIIDLVYETFSEQTPKRFDYTQNTELSEFLFENDIHVDKDTTWLEIVDDLFDKQHYREAAIAQRYAVPTLPDCAAAVRDGSIAAIYKGVVASNESVIDYVWRMINEAINTYVILAAPTAFDLEDCRIISIDLDDVCPKGSAQADKQTSIMYMIGRYITSQRFFTGRQMIEFVPDKYKEYHVKLVKEVAKVPKLICFDEFHRTSTVKQVRSQVERDVREGRKWGVQIVLFSQSPEDFDTELVNLSSTRFILGANTIDVANDICERFHLSMSARDIIYHDIVKPNANGSGVYCSAKTVEGNAEMNLMLTIGPIENWAFESHNLNRELKSILYEKLGSRRALEILAKHYPSGTIVDELELRQSTMAENTEAMRLGLIESIANELIKAAQH